MFYTVLGVENDETCLGACDGAIQVDVTGGVSPYVAMATELSTGNLITSSMGISNSIVPGICSGTYTLTFSDENGCSSNLINGGIDQETIITNNATVAEINNSSIVNVLCNGSSTGSLEALNPNLSSGYSYSWQDLNGVIVSTTFTASNLLSGTYVLYADYNNTPGCTSTDTALVSELSIINPSAVVTNVDCFGNSTGMLQGAVVGGTAPYNFLWNPGSISGSMANNLQAGTYTLTVTDVNNCQEVDTFEVTEPAVLSANIIQNGFVLTAVVPAGGTAPYSYSWFEQSSPFSSLATGLNYVVSNYGTYYVEITDANGCEEISNTVSYDEGPLGTIDLNDLINTVSVYPNPFREEVTVDFGRNISSATIKLVDVYGKLIEIYDLKDSDKQVIKRTDKASGVYLIEIEINDMEFSTKVILN